MKTRNKITGMLLLLAALALPTIESCNKYPEGPKLSLRSREERVANTWKVENYKVNSDDRTSLVADYEQTFSKNGDYSYNWGAFNGSGNWSFQNDDKEIQVTGNSSTETLVIVKLEEKAFWYYYMDGSDKHEYHLLQK